MEINLKLFEDFKSYLLGNGYEVNLDEEESIRGIKKTIKFHFFFDFKYDKYTCI